MKGAGKIIIGAILVIAGIYWYLAGNIMGFTTGSANLQALWNIFRGSIGVLVFLVGAFIVWLEADELKMEREMESGFEEEPAVEETKKETEEVEEVKEAVGEKEKSESEGDFVCEICGKSFKSERGLKIHKGRQH